MARIIIKNLGPIKDIELEIKNINILFGPQASGKSLISRVIYFFENYIDNFVDNILITNKELSYEEHEELIFQSFHNKFYDFMQDNTFVKYIFDKDIYINIDNKNKTSYFTKLKEILVYINLNPNFKEKYYSAKMAYTDVYISLRKIVHIKHEKSLFIPDARNSINLLEKYSKIISIKEDILSFDWTIPQFISILSIINDKLADGIKRYSRGYLESQIPILDYCIELIGKILKGEYKVSNGEARIYITDDKYIKLNNASSGQREVLPILNIIFYLFGRNYNLFIEEPETHLFPEAQMYMMELLSAFVNSGNKIFFTTHSPYLLACANNLIYASNLAKGHENDKERLAKISEIVDKKSWIDYDNLSVNFIEDKGIAINILDKEEKLIDDKKIDYASDIIMEKFNSLFDEVETFDLEEQ